MGLLFLERDSKYLRNSIPDGTIKDETMLHALAFAATCDIRQRSKITRALMILDTLGALQQYIFSAIAQSLYSKCTALQHTV